MKLPKAVFFDCWSTVISFRERYEDWNTRPLKRHCQNLSEVDFGQVEKYSIDFFKDYYGARLNYEIQAEQFLQLMVELFHIKLDCSVSECQHEILDGLDPQPLKGLLPFLDYLEENNIYKAILSNTIYSDEDSVRLLDKLIGKNRFAYFAASATYGVKKPNPSFFLAAMARSNFKPEESIYIGDAFYQDVFGSFQTGFSQSIWLNEKGQKKEDYASLVDLKTIRYKEVSGYDQLLKIMKEGNLYEGR